MISSLGIGSGLDLSGLVAQLLAAERAPVESRLNQKEATYQTQLSALGNLKASLAQVNESFAALQDLESSRSTSVTGEDGVLTASAEQSAAVGSYTVSVSQLATAHSVASTAYTNTTDEVGDGTLTFTFGTTDYDAGGDTYNSFTANAEATAFSVVIDSSADTLEDVRDAVNTADGGVTASIVNDGSGNRLVFTSDLTGESNSLEVTVVDGDGGHDDTSGLSNLAFNSAATNLQQTNDALDANLTISGLAVTSASNSVTEAIAGVTLALEGTTTTDPVTVAVTNNTGSPLTALNGMIAAYNEFIELANDLNLYNPETGESGALLGDITLRGARSAMQGTLIEPVRPGHVTMQSLIDLGMTSAEDGTISLDLDTINGLIDSDYDEVISFVNELGDSMEDALAPFAGSSNVLDARTDGLQVSIDDITDQRFALSARLEQLEVRYTKQFAALDSLIASLNQTSSFLAQQLSSLPGARSSNSNN